MGAAVFFFEVLMGALMIYAATDSPGTDYSSVAPMIPLAITFAAMAVGGVVTAIQLSRKK
jgi:hypothetical protein